MTLVKVAILDVKKLVIVVKELATQVVKVVILDV